MKLHAFSTQGGGVFFRTSELPYIDYKYLGAVEVDIKIEIKKKPYPKVKKHNDSPLVVLFSQKDEGIVVISSNLHPTGEKSKTWCETNFHDIDLLPLDYQQEERPKLDKS